jgi:hypothetical protein
MADVEDDKGVGTQSASDMGFGGAADLGNVNVGAAYDADRGGLGSGLGLTDDRSADLGGQVSRGDADAWGPSFGTKSNIGGVVGTVAGLLAGVPGAGLIGAYGPGAVNSIMGRGGTPEMPGIFGSGPGGNSIAGVGASGSGGLLGVGNDTSQADALAALYTLLMAKQKAA